MSDAGKSRNDGGRGPQSARSGPPTIDDVAALAGVGRATVSRALNDQANVSARARQRVLDAVAALDYRVNPQARSLASRTSNALALVHGSALNADPNSYYHSALELGALRAASVAGFELSTYYFDTADPRRAEKVVDLFVSGQAAGLILTPPLSDDAVLAAQLVARGCPTVCVSPSSEVRALLPGVGFDEEEAGYAVTRHALQHGHRRFGYLHGIEGHLSAEKRYAGFLRALAEQGIGVETVTALRGDFSFRAGVELGERLLRQEPRPTAIICANDDMAVGALFVTHRLNLTVPCDVSIAGFDDAPIAAHIWPPLTTVHQPIRRIAGRAVEWLAEMLARGGGTAPPAFEMIDYHLVIRDSVDRPAD